MATPAAIPARLAASGYHPTLVSSPTASTLTTRPDRNATLNLANRWTDAQAPNVHRLFSEKLLIAASSIAIPDAGSSGRPMRRASRYSRTALMRVPVIPTTPNFTTLPNLAPGGLITVASLVNWGLRISLLRKLC